MRSFLLFIIFLITGLFLLVGLSVRSSAQRAAADIRSSMPAGISLTANIPPTVTAYEVTYNEKGEAVYTTTAPVLFESDLDKLSAIDGIRGYHIRMERSTVYTGLDVHPGHNVKDLDVLAGKAPADSEEYLDYLKANKEHSEAWGHSNSFSFVYDSEYYPAFVNGALKLVEGRHIKKDDIRKTLISEELAARNGLQVGDSIKAYLFDLITGERYGDAYEAEIIGIFRVNFEQKVSEWASEPDILENVIFVDREADYWSSRTYLTHYKYQVRAREENPGLAILTLYVEDPSMIDSVKEQLFQIDTVNWDYYKIKTYSQDYENAAGPLLTMVKLSNALIFLMAAGSLLILSLLLTMWMRSRKAEICVLSSIGVKRNTILAQFLLECCVISSAAFLCAALISRPVTNVLGNALLELLNPSGQSESYQVILALETSDMYVNLMPVRQEPLQYSMPLQTTGLVFLAVLTVSVFSVLFSSLRMLNQKPREMYFGSPEKGSAKAVPAAMENGNAGSSRRTKHTSHAQPLRTTPVTGRMTARRRAFLYVSRKTGKTALLLITFVTILTVMLVGTSIHHASGQAAARLRETLSGYFEIDTDYESSDTPQHITQPLIDRVMKLDGIKACNAMDTCLLTVSGLALEPGRFTAEGNSKAQMTRILGNMDSSLNEYFTRNIFALGEGRHLQPEDSGKALISRTLAESNQLHTGDTFSASITEDTAAGSEAAGTSYSFEIVGIFDEVQQSFSSENTAECDIASNFIFIDTASSQSIRRALSETAETVYTGGASFYVTDPREMNRIVNQVKQLDGIDWDSLKLTVNNTAYEKHAGPIERLNGTASLMVGLIAVIGMILLSLLLALWERDRIHEAGVLMSFGISKWNILMQHFWECASVFLIAFLLSALLSLPVSGQIGQSLYSREVTRAEQTAETSEYSLADTLLSTDTSAEEIDFQTGLHPLSIAVSGVLGLLLVSVSSGTAFLVTARRRPKELLTIME